MKLNKKSKGKFVGLSSFMAVFMLLGAAVLCPFDGNVVEAATQSQKLRIDFVLRQALDSKRLSIDFFLNSNGGIDYDQIAKTLGIDFYLMDYIGISGLQDVIKSETITPTVGGTEISGESSLTVATNNTNGLIVKVSGEPEMVNSANANAKIGATAGVTSVNALDMNTWGYNLVATGDSNPNALKPVSTDGSTDSRTFAAGEYELALKFGAKVNTGVASGTYSSDVKVEVAPNPTSTAYRMAVIRSIDQTLEEYFQEHPEERAKYEEARAKKLAEKEAEAVL